MLLSIIVPSYNVEKYIGKCIKSLLTQEEIKYEIIIVNDGSTDSTLRIAKEFNKEYDNVVLINQENKGLGGARNTGIKNARGKYITFVDSDDYLVDNAYGIMFKNIECQDFDILIYNFKNVYENYSNTPFYNKDIKKEFLEGIDIIKEFYENKISSYAWDKVYDIKLFKDNSIYFPENKLYEDLRTSYEVIRNVKRAIKLDFPCYLYLQRTNSISKSIKRKNLDDFISEYLKVLNSIENQNNKNLANEINTYKALKYNALIRMKMKLKNENYKIDNRIKFKLTIKQLYKSKNLNINEKLINVIGENIVLFNLLQRTNKFIGKLIFK